MPAANVQARFGSLRASQQLGLGVSLTSRLLMRMLKFKAYPALTFVTIEWHVHNLPGGRKAREEKEKENASSSNALHLANESCNPRGHVSIILVQTLAMGLGDAEDLMTEKIAKQEVRRPLSPWTNCVRISLVPFGLRMAHKMFYSRHPALEKITRPKPSNRQRSLC